MSNSFSLSNRNMSEEVAQYNAVDKWCSKMVSSGAEFLFDPVMFHQALYKASKEFEFPFEALLSFFRNTHLLHVKKVSSYIRGRVDQFAEEYTKGTSILSLAISNNYPPSLFSRILVEKISTVGKRGLADSMRDPVGHLGDPVVIDATYLRSETIKRSDDAPRIDPLTLKSVTRLAQEVIEAIDADPMYGPSHDLERNEIGVEYEKRLEQILIAMDVPFESEIQLRERGTSRTPDVLLSCPMGVRVPKKNGSDQVWKVVCWIDSKAMFGDVNTHQTSVLPQAESYVHRFGPGLILYWFGHAPLEMLDDAHGDIVMASWGLPEPMLFPTGELAQLENGETSSDA